MSLKLVDVAPDIIGKHVARWIREQAGIDSAHLRDEDCLSLFQKLSLEWSQKFEFEKSLFTQELIDAGLEALNNGLLPLPANPFFFEWDGMDSLRFGCLGFVSDGKGAPLGPGGADVLSLYFIAHLPEGDGDPSGFSYFGGMRVNISGPEVGKFETEAGWRDIVGEDFFQCHLARVLVCCMALRCRDVVVHDCGPSPSVKRKREKRGQAPILEFKKVTIKPELRGVYEAASQEVERNGPRLHFRRGHIRNLPQGRGQTYVSPCWVGNAALGVVEKQYEVKQ